MVTANRSTAVDLRGKKPEELKAKQVKPEVQIKQILEDTLKKPMTEDRRLSYLHMYHTIEYSNMVWDYVQAVKGISLSYWRKDEQGKPTIRHAVARSSPVSNKMDECVVRNKYVKIAVTNAQPLVYDKLSQSEIYKKFYERMTDVFLGSKKKVDEFLSTLERHSLYIAGGFITSILFNTPTKDIDIFNNLHNNATRINAYKELIDFLSKAFDKYVIYKTANTITFKTEHISFEIIVASGSDPTTTLMRFDISAAHYRYQHSNRTIQTTPFGHYTYMTGSIIIDAQNSNHNMAQRISNYMRKGFTVSLPDGPMIREIITHPNFTLTGAKFTTLVSDRDNVLTFGKVLVLTMPYMDIKCGDLEDIANNRRAIIGTDRETARQFYAKYNRRPTTITSIPYSWNSTIIIHKPSLCRVFGLADHPGYYAKTYSDVARNEPMRKAPAPARATLNAAFDDYIKAHMDLYEEKRKNLAQKREMQQTADAIISANRVDNTGYDSDLDDYISGGPLILDMHQVIADQSDNLSESGTESGNEADPL